MRALCGVIWYRLCEWLEPAFPELGDWLSDDEEDEGA